MLSIKALGSLRQANLRVKGKPSLQSKFQEGLGIHRDACLKKFKVKQTKMQTKRLTMVIFCRYFILYNSLVTILNHCIFNILKEHAFRIADFYIS